MNLTGKRVIVTGGSDGIGRHICLKLADQGCAIAIVGRNQARLDAVVAECKARGAAEARAYAADLTDAAAIEQAAAAMLDDFGGMDTH